LNEQQKQHNQYQKQYFDDNANYFEQPIPDDVEIKLGQIVAKATLNQNSFVLDIGTGMGVLIKHIIASGVLSKNIAAIDLSAKMLSKARDRYPEVQFWQGDVLDFEAQTNSFDAIFFNACFGNLFSPDAAVCHVSKLIKPGGCAIISHPLGNKFVSCLHDMNPDLVPRHLPKKNILEKWCSNYNLQLSEYIDEPEFYLAKLQKNG
jgi:ubiquinone/menaquinone biosynthesis C-methylase UbiE